MNPLAFAFMVLALLLFLIETVLHIWGGEAHRPEWGHFFTPGGFFFLTLGLIIQFGGMPK